MMKNKGAVNALMESSCYKVMMIIIMIIEKKKKKYSEISTTDLR